MIRSAVSWADSRRRSATITWAPSRASKSAVARPLPIVSPGVCPPPTTMAILSATRPGIVLRAASRKYRVLCHSEAKPKNPLLVHWVENRGSFATLRMTGPGICETQHLGALREKRLDACGDGLHVGAAAQPRREQAHDLALVPRTPGAALADSRLDGVFDI